MIRKLNKKPDSKRGAILVMVVFILAMAIIFISACMMLTQATRQRAYVEAESSQARLTCTSAAEAFYQALMTQEFTDSSLDTLAKANSTLNIQISGATVPGLSSASNNCTTLHLYVPSGYPSLIYADFKTTIGDSVEGCRIVFKHATTPPKTDIFSNQIDIVGDMSHLFDASSGAGAPAGATDNNVVIRGDYHTNTTGNTTNYSNYIFTGDSDGSDIYFERTENYKGDVVFLKDARMKWNSTSVTFSGNVFFIGDSGQRSFTDTSGASRSYATSTSNWVFVNRSVANSESSPNIIVSMLGGAKSTLVLNASQGWNGSSVTSYNSALSGNSSYNSWKTAFEASPSTLTTDLSSAISTYTSADYNTDENKYPTTSAAFSSLGLASTHTVTTGQGFANFVQTYHYANYGDVAPAGTYYFTGQGSSTDLTNAGNSKKPLVVILDGSQDYTFYFAANQTFYMNWIVFAVVNPNDNHRQTFILETGANLLETTANGEDGHYNHGFVSVYRSSATSAATLYNTIMTGNIATDTAACYDSKHKPAIFIYGAGSNTIKFHKHGVLEAYVGLFDTNYASSTSELIFENQGHYVYGRWQIPDLSNAASQAINLRYCPNPNTKTTDPYIKQVSSYSVVDFIYGTF